MAEKAPGTDLLGRRLGLVANISSLNAEVLKQMQLLGAVEMDVLRLELEEQQTGSGEELAREIREAKGRAQAIRAAQVEREERIASVESEVDEIDRQLAALDET